MFGKFLFASLSSFVVDISLFTLLVGLTKGVSPAYYILVSTVLARIVSSTFNFLVNKNRVFKKKTGGWAAYVKYGILCVCQMLLSACGVWALAVGMAALTGGVALVESVAKIIVDSILFLVSFQIQREWVFK